MKRKTSYLATIISLDIWCLRTSFWLIHLVYCLLDMYKSLLLITFMEALFIMILHPVLFGLKIRYIQEPVRQSQRKTFFEQQLWDQACVEIFHMNIDNVVFATTTIKSNIYLELDHSIITQYQKEQLKISCIWKENLWITLPCIGQIMGWMTYHYGPLPSSMLHGFIISYQITVLVSHHQIFSPAIMLAIAI